MYILMKKDICCIFRPAFGCCALQKLVEIVIFRVFSAKNLKKVEICSKFLQKKKFLLSLHQNAGRLFYSQKWAFFYVWSAQHPNAGRNIQQLIVTKNIDFYYFTFRFKLNSLLGCKVGCFRKKLDLFVAFIRSRLIAQR